MFYLRVIVPFFSLTTPYLTLLQTLSRETIVQYRTSLCYSSPVSVKNAFRPVFYLSENKLLNPW